VTGVLLLATLALHATGTLHRFEIAAPELHDAHRAVRVYTPAGYDDASDAGRRYPVVYLLHGWPGSDGNWPGLGRAIVTADSLIASGRMPPAILVFPNGNGKGFLGRSLYLDSQDESSRMEQFLVDRLPGWVDATFRTLPACRAVIGLSDGGTAAINLLLRYPDRFVAAASHSADLRIRRDYTLHAVLGPEPGATRLAESRSPLAYAAQAAPGMAPHRLYFDCGRDDESAADNREFDALLTRLGVPHEYHEFAGTHGWGYWRTHLVSSLRAVTEGMPCATPAPSSRPGLSQVR
jgi:S-formylglutathione hydrolase FrmB